MTNHTSRREFAGMMLAPFAFGKGDANRLVFCCASENDLYRALSSPFHRYDSASEAVERAPRDSGVLILADLYPETAVSVPENVLARAREKNLRLYIEYAGSVKEARRAEWERAVVTGSFFGESLPAQRILSLHKCSYLPLPDGRGSVHMALARVAGFDTAVYGLPEKDVRPLLVQDGQTLIAASALSRFITARYAPVAAWTLVWRKILEWLAGAEKVDLQWTPAVRPSWDGQRSLTESAERDALRRGAEWYSKARLLIHPSWAHKLEEARKFNDQVGPGLSKDMPLGDGSLGVLEGHSSVILPDGSQPTRWWIRADCVGETAMTLALAGKQDGVARNLVEFLLSRSKMANGSRLDPASPSYGLIGWNETPNYHNGEDGFDVYYGDDNARALLGALTASTILGETRWEERFWLAVLGNFRLLGTLGFQKSRYDQAPLEKNGWRSYHESPIVLHDMNYQAYPWALFLWAYTKTGYAPFLEKTEKGIRQTMAAYPDQWRWSNSITSQQARILLPLAWLIRVKDTSEAREWFKRIADDLLSHQHASGAIEEWTGRRETGLQMPPDSNEKYGAGEGTLTQRNGDTATDLLYTMNFAFIGLHEAYAATGEKQYKDAADRIAGFLVRAQVKSEAHPEFDGAWYRAFDYGAWDYWASNSDSGWGAWCTEAGWSQSWITTVFALRDRKRSLWEIIGEARAFPKFDALRAKMQLA